MLYQGVPAAPWYHNPASGSGDQGPRRERLPQFADADKWWDAAADLNYAGQEYLLVKHTTLSLGEVRDMPLHERTLYAARILRDEDFKVKLYNNLVEVMIKLWSKDGGR